MAYFSGIAIQIAGDDCVCQAVFCSVDRALLVIVMTDRGPLVIIFCGNFHAADGDLH